MLINQIRKEFNDKMYITRQDLRSIGISESSIDRLFSEGKLMRISRGLYSVTDAFDDEMFILHNDYKTGIYSHESALYIHGLSDRIPDIHVMTVPSNYDRASAKDDRIRFRFVYKKYMILGAENHKSEFGNELPVYNEERTICDIIKSDTKMDPYVVNEAIRRFMKKGKPAKLMIYATKLGIEKKVRKKIEVLL